MSTTNPFPEEEEIVEQEPRAKNQFVVNNDINILSSDV